MNPLDRLRSLAESVRKQSGVRSKVSDLLLRFHEAQKALTQENDHLFHAFEDMDKLLAEWGSLPASERIALGKEYGEDLTKAVQHLTALGNSREDLADRTWPLLQHAGPDARKDVQRALRLLTRVDAFTPTAFKSAG